MNLKNIKRKSAKNFWRSRNLWTFLFRYDTRILALVDCFFNHKSSGHQRPGDFRCILHTEVAGTGHDSRFWERMLLTVDTQHRWAKLGKIVGVCETWWWRMAKECWQRFDDSLGSICIPHLFVGFYFLPCLASLPFGIDRSGALNQVTLSASLNAMEIASAWQMALMILGSQPGVWWV